MDNKIENEFTPENSTNFENSRFEGALRGASRKSRLVSQILLKGDESDEEINKGRS
ncbi:MAG: hypothetical protein ACM3TR_14840 [Caulobacteraceae bacterium]